MLQEKSSSCKVHLILVVFHNSIAAAREPLQGILFLLGWRVPISQAVLAQPEALVLLL